MRVLMIVHGAHDYVRELAEELSNQCELTVAFSEGYGKHDWGTGQRYTLEPLESHDSKLTRGVDWSLRCAKLVRSIRPDLVHVQVTNAFVLSTLVLMRTPIVVTVHDPVLHPGERGLLRRLTGALELIGGRWFVVHGVHGAGVLQRRGISRDRLLIHELGPLTMYGDPDSYVPSSGRSILFFGRIHRYKGIEHLLRAIELRDQEPALVIAGGGDRDYLNECVRNSRIEPAIVDGFVDQETTTRLFRQATVVCVPYVDGSQSGVIGIAKGCGRAVVSTDVGDLASAVQAPDYGMTVPPANAERLAAALSHLLDNDTERLAIERRSLRYTQSRPWQAIAKSLANRYALWLDSM